MKKPIKKKTQAEIEFEENQKINAMRDFGFACKDMNGQPFFLPDGTGYTMNPKCTMSWSDFQMKFRDYYMKNK